MLGHITGADMVIMIILTLFAGGGMFYVLSRFLKHLHAIEEDLYGSPETPDTVMAFLRDVGMRIRNIRSDTD